MKIAIVYDSRTGNTEAAARALAARYRERGDEVALLRVDEADPAAVAAADLVCVGSWTQGLFVVLQHATAATMRFIDRLPPLAGKEALVFCSYALSPGRTLARMAGRLEHKGARVAHRVAFRGRAPAAGWDAFAAAVGGR